MLRLQLLRPPAPPSSQARAQVPGPHLQEVFGLSAIWQAGVCPPGLWLWPGGQWVQSKDKNGFGQLMNVEESLCLNIQKKNCKGGLVHLFDCQGSDAKVHDANHFHFDSGTGEIVSEFCKGKCVGV